MNPNDRIYITADVNFNENSFPFKNDSKFMITESTHASESVNTFSEFLSISFPSETQSHEAPAASINSLDDTTISDNPSNEQNSDNILD